MAVDKKAISYAAFLALLLIATAALLWWISSVFVELDQSTLAVFLAALLAFSGNWYSQYAISVRSVKEGHREQKVKVYTECIASFVKVHDFIKKEPTANLHDQKWFLCEMAAVNENLLLWGSSCPTSACVRQIGVSVFKWFETDGLISQRRDWLIGFKV